MDPAPVEKSSLKIQILSDLHLEWFPEIEKVEDLPEPLCNIPVVGQVMALCGDIGNPFLPVYRAFLNDMSDKFKLVLVVAGNHEYYSSNIRETDEQIALVVGAFDNVKYLQRSKFEFQGKTFLGATLWTKIPEEPVEWYNEYWRRISDYSRIKIHDEKEGLILLEPRHQNILHTKDEEWFEKELQVCADEGKDVIIFTHHAPIETHIQNTEMRKGGSLNSLRFLDFSDQTPLMTKYPNIKLWGFGHTHHSSSQIFCKTRIVSNCLGYIKREQSDPCFEKSFFVDLDDPTVGESWSIRGHYEVPTGDAAPQPKEPEESDCSLF